jgi:O-antigen/teichoic acid export membrane protein
MVPLAAVSHRRLARHTVWNVLGYILPLIVAFFALPPMVTRLGPERYGLLSLVLVVHEYFSYFDFGLGRATTRFIANALHDPERCDTVGTVLWTCVAFHVGLGLVAGAGFAVALPFVGGRLLTVPPDLVTEGRLTLYAAALLAPVLLLMIAARGALEAAQRFDLVNTVKVPSNALTYVIPLVGAGVGLTLPAIVLLLVLARLAVALLYLGLCLRLFPSARRLTIDPALRRPLFSFGGWVMVANLAGLLLVYGDRFLISALASVGALTYYSVPQDVSTRLWIVPASIASALFPMFSLTGGRPDTPAGRLYADSVLYLLILFVPVVAVLEVFGGPLLGLWMGAGFADEATAVLQVITLGVFLDSLARIPLTYLQASGHPALPGRVRLLQVPPYLLVAGWAIHHWGILGAAWAWSGRIAVETVLLFWLTRRYSLVEIPRDTSRRLVLGATASVLVLSVSALLAWLLQLETWVMLAGLTLLLGGFAWYAWRALVDPAHRTRLGLLLARVRAA